MLPIAVLDSWEDLLYRQISWLADPPSRWRLPHVIGGFGGPQNETGEQA